MSYSKDRFNKILLLKELIGILEINYTYPDRDKGMNINNTNVSYSMSDEMRKKIYNEYVELVKNLWNLDKCKICKQLTECFKFTIFYSEKKDSELKTYRSIEFGCDECISCVQIQMERSNTYNFIKIEKDEKW